MEEIRLDYNTERPRLEMSEYGRNILQMVEHLKTIEDKTRRTEQAHAVVKSMEMLNPQVRSQENWQQKLWDHLYIISGFDLDIDSPYPCPAPESFETKPVALPMKNVRIRANHYGRNIEKIIDLLCAEPEGEVKTSLLRGLATYMRQQYLIWNKDSVADETIFADIEKLSDHRLTVPEGFSLDKIEEGATFSRPSISAIGGVSGPQRKNNHRNRNKGRRRQ